ncbi:putative cation transporter protein [Trypanosoma rangeli]|uniref:Putative cation transporter protein n=1 Tax=Trypanosoma rangeli TaxID=5698 RepID=A0A422NFP8_TRYRA|nr:putative cation transporter protein [Trypanosoma rangeli]RNF04288.1 putative cation transporter protein [Trypanosoma rangeli]|eukprot:RNF04288.1 putative cation transporter protein [Trypanosoma rangeli]
MVRFMVSALVAAGFAAIVLMQNFVLQNSRANFLWVGGFVSLGETLMFVAQGPENTKGIYKCSLLQCFYGIIMGTVRAYICGLLLWCLKEMGPLFSVLFYCAFALLRNFMRTDNLKHLRLWFGCAVFSVLLLYVGLFIEKGGDVCRITLAFAGLGVLLFLAHFFEANCPMKNRFWQMVFEKLIASIELSICGWLYYSSDTASDFSYTWLLFPLLSVISGCGKTIYDLSVGAAIVPFDTNEVLVFILKGCFVSLFLGGFELGDFIVMISTFTFLICSLKAMHCSSILPSLEPSNFVLPKHKNGLTYVGGALLFFFTSERERKLGIFFLLTLVVMVLELIYGISANSLGLVSDSFHMLLDSVSIAVGLVTEFASSFPGDKKTHPFGYARYRVLGGFINAVLLLFIALFVVIESIERLLCPPDIHAAYLIHVAFIGLILNLIGVVFFHGADGHSHSHDGCSRSVDHNLRGIYLHILADLVGSINVMISSILLSLKGWKIADPLCSLVSCVFIAVSAFPLLEETGKILLLSGHPYDQEIFFQKAIAGIEDIAYVNSVENIFAWPHSTAPNESAYCAIRLSVHAQANHNQIRLSVRQFMKEFFRGETGSTHLSVIVHIE